MFTYTVDGTTYYVSGDRMYVTLDEEHGVEDVDDHAVHLYESDEYRQYLVRLEWGGEVFSSVTINALDQDGPPSRHVRVDEFDTATPVKAIIPEEVNECPKCGSWAGDADDSPRCISCGYGINDPDEDTSSAASD
jgi:hypothetical protein